VFLRRFAPRLLLVVSVLAASSIAAQQAAQPAKLARALPLNHFAASRLTQTDARGFYFMPIAVGDDYFDGTSSPERVERHLRVAREVGASYLRCAFTWNAIEKAKGQYDWTFWDRLVEAAERNGIELIPYVAYTPEWAASVKEDFWAQPPSDPQLLADFMYEAALRYRERIHAWEIWNEPDNREYWRGSPQEFVRLVELAAVSIRRADPSAVLVLGGMSLGPGDFFQALMRQYHVDRYVDVIATHAYPESWEPLRAEREYHDWIAQMQQLIRDGGMGVDFWANEMGYADYRFKPNQASKYGVSVTYNYEHTTNFAATSLFKVETMALASSEVSLTGWYRIDDFPATETRLGDDGVNYHLGLLDTQGHPKPAYFALKFFRHVFDEPVRTISMEQRLDQTVIDVFVKKNGKLVVVGWLRSSEASEVSDHSGMASDPRRAQVSVAVPCRRVSRLRSWDEQGRATRNRARFHSGRLDSVPLTGAHIFIAEMNCTP
jgi:hypothetical protein